MPTDDRPDQIEGISTDRGHTPGDPELRTVNAAPDLADDAPEGDASEVEETRGDETPGTPLDPK